MEIILNKDILPSRRDFLKVSAASCIAFSLPLSVSAMMKKVSSPVTIGMITDLHQDVMHDGTERMQVFVDEVSRRKPNAIIQLGDFAYPGDKNKNVIDLFNGAHDRAFHVIGNHDTDNGYTVEQCLSYWKMPSRYYVENIDGINFVFLDGNEKGSPTSTGGYASYIGEAQKLWLADKLASANGPIVIVSHQPIAGSYAVDNAENIQDLLSEYSDKILFAINGHSHIDDLLKVKGITYVHLNSASYLWVGGDFKNKSYNEQTHKDFPWIEYTCPYRDSIFAFITIHPETGTVQIEGKKSEWVGKPPNELGVDIFPELTLGEEVAPRIRARSIFKLTK